MKDSKAVGHVVTLINSEGKELFLNGVFVNVMKDNNALAKEGIDLQKLFDFLINRAADKGVTVEVRELNETASKEPSGFFD